jgi:hypothetical protein
MIRFHPHVGGINQTIEPILTYRNKSAFMRALKKLARAEGLTPFRESDVNFYHCGRGHDRDASEAFNEFADATGWDVQSVLIRDSTVGYSDRAYR